jgi:hypothetical protein
MPDFPVISGVADLPKFYFPQGAPFRLTLSIGAEFSMTGKFVAFGMRARSGTIRRIFRTDSGESNLTIAGQVITLNIATDAATVPAFASGWTLEDVQAHLQTEYWVDISATEGSDILLRLQGQLDWVEPGSDIAESSAIVESPSIDVAINSGAISASISVLGAAEPTLTTNTVTSGLTGILKAASNSLDVAVAGTDYVATNDSRLTDARTPTSHVHGGISNAGAIGTTSGLPIKTGTSGVLEVGAFGTSSGQFAQGNDARFHDRSHAITSTSDHTAGNWKVFHSNGSGQLVELALGADGTFLKSNGTAAAPSFATPAGGGSSITGTGFAYVRTGGSATPTIGNPALPFATMQTVWSAGTSSYAFDVGPGDWTLDALHPTTSGDIHTFFLRGAGPQSTISLTWRMADNPIGNGYDTPALRIFSDKSVKISLTIEGGDSTSIDSAQGGKVGNYEFYNCWIETLTLTPGEGSLGAGPGQDADSGYAEYTVIQNGAMEATTITRKAVVEGGIFYPLPVVSDGNKGAITVSSGGTNWSINATSVGLGNLQQASAKGNIIGRKTAGSGDYEVCAITDFTGVVGAVYAESTDFTTSTGALVNVTGLSCPIAINEKLLVEVVGYKNTSSANDGMRFSFTGPAGASSVLFNLEAWTATTASRVTPVQSGFNTNALETTGNVSSFPFRATCTIINGGTGGTVQFQAGSEASGVSLTISRGAVMRVTRIA